MVNQFGGWRQLWMMLAVMWTIVAIASGWMNLPRAQQIPHDPQFLSRLSFEAASILHGTYVNAKPDRGALVWSDSPRIVRMWNDMRLTFPATTTDERAAFVASEYRQLLNVEADKQMGPYLLEMLAIWLAPLLVAGLAANLFRRGYEPALSTGTSSGDSPSYLGSADASAFAMSGTGDWTDGGATASSAAHPVPISLSRPPYANGELLHGMFANEQRKPRAGATIA